MRALPLTVALTLVGWTKPLHLPYREAGLSPQEAAAHLLNRFAYGPRPGEVEAVVRQGLESWVEVQLSGRVGNTACDILVSKVPGDSERLAQRKVLRSTLSERQMEEVLSEFWFNHFNVSLTDGDCRTHVADYEENAIRPNVLRRFRVLLGATAHHPAMLYYLDNAYSRWDRETQPATPLEDPFNYQRRPQLAPPRPPTAPNKKGLNENYARELLELHTLGVDGGYRQEDVTEVARVFTGWSVARAKDEKARFEFRDKLHDPTPKRFLFQTLAPAGENEGEKVLDMLASHPSTARFLSRKLAVRFVCDQPPPALVERLSRTFLRSQGDLRATVECLLESPEFWSREHLRSKVKSPLELQASSLRILGARLDERVQLQGSLASMGQELYHCRPPTGWPDRPETWLTPGNLVQRMGFAHRLAEGELQVKFSLENLRPARPPRNLKQALKHYAETILPGRQVDPVVRLLLAPAADPAYGKSVVQASKKGSSHIPRPQSRGRFEFTPATQRNLIGLLLGCPEFQRR